MNTCQTCVWWLPNRDIKEPLPRRLCLNPKVGIETDIDFGCTLHMGSNATEVNVPLHTKDPAIMGRNTNPVDGPVEIFIVSYPKDYPWLNYCIRALEKYCSGFQGITVAHPNGHPPFPYATPGIRRFPFDEAPGKGFLHHQIIMARADKILPEPTKYVMHLDSDCIYHTPTTPEDYFLGDKPVYLIRSYASLTTEDPRNPGSKVVSDCAQWKGPSERQLGFEIDMYTMCRHPTVLPISFYEPYRKHIESAHSKPFDEYMLDGKNSFPQDRMDWTAMGAWAFKFMPTDFTWIDLGLTKPPRDRQKAYWSHGGITPEIRAEIERFVGA